MKKFFSLILLTLFVAGPLFAGDEDIAISPSELLGDFVQIPAGTFMMGSPETESGRNSDEFQHQVTLTQDFEMMKTEVTQKMWVDVMGENPSYFKGDNLPVEQVSWDDVQVFIDRLNEIQGIDCGDQRTMEGFKKAMNTAGCYRLPTEAEWEYAARAGTKTAYSFRGGDNEAILQEYGWFIGNSQNQTHEVASKTQNPWGLYDMHGNVLERVEDWYQSDLGTSSQEDPKGPSSGSRRVLRGGGFFIYAELLRSACRMGEGSVDRHPGVGFRLVRTKN